MLVAGWEGSGRRGGKRLQVALAELQFEHVYKDTHTHKKQITQCNQVKQRKLDNSFMYFHSALR